MVRYLTKNSVEYPSILIKRLGNDAPETIAYIGDINILALQKTALFCSKDTPASVILYAYDKIAELRDSGRCVISGFHSPIEKDCLKILMRGSQPIIVCPAREIEAMRITYEFQKRISEKKLLMLSPFINSPKRINQKSAIYRNRFVAALSDDTFIAFSQKDSHTEGIVKLLDLWKF